MKLKLFYILLLNFLISSFAFAQAIPNTAFIKTNPTYIVPNSTINVYVDTYRFNTDKATYTWKVNGKVIASGEGIKSVPIKVSDGGQILNISVTVISIDGLRYDLTKTINPGEIKLVWESVDGYTPAWYTGKALPTYGSKIKVVAFPEIIENNKIISSDQLVYRWYVNDEIQSGYSGLGKNFLVYQAREEQLDNITIDVEVETKNSSETYSNGIKIPFVEPEVNIYEKSSTFGILSNFSLTSAVSFVNKEINLVAEPFYFSSKNKDSLKYIWEVNDQVGLGQMNSERFIKIPENKTGISKINLKVINDAKLLQDATKGFVIKF